MPKDEYEEEVLLKKWRAQLSRGILEFLVLILLQKERHGWDILQLVRSLLLPTEPPLADGTIYNILTRLKERELVSSRSKIIEGRMRRYFKLSKKGKVLLTEMIKDWKSVIISISEAEEISKT